MHNHKKYKLIMLAGAGESTNIMYHSLSKKYNIESVIIEEKISKKQFFKYRIKKLGIQSVLGQIIFMLIISPILKKVATKRKNEILQRESLSHLPIPKEKIINLKTVNSQVCRQEIRRLNPDLIIVNGTRIISKKTLEAIPAKFVNIHAGITPKYRGVHGGYWALTQRDISNCGVTVHFIDEGVDSGQVISQASITPTIKDNFSTYPFLQIALGLKLLKKNIPSILENKTTEFGSNHIDSFQWFHPTILQYLTYYLRYGVK